jgi:hypothetical protein
MTKNRIGFSSNFVLTNDRIGIGTTNPGATLTVIGNTNIVGVTTSSSFSGDVFNAYPFYSGITSSVYASPTGTLNPIITFPSTSGKRYIIHSINVSNKARKQPTGAGATVGIATTTGAVTSVRLTATGAGYTSGDVFVSMGTTDYLNRIRGLVSFATTSFVGVGTTGDPAYAGITSAIGIVTSVSGGQITGIAITYNGFGYTSPPAITFNSPVGLATTTVGMTTAVGTAATAVLTYGEVVAAYLNIPGEGYKTPPTISIASTSGTAAQITADVDSDGKVIRLNLINRGYGYSKLNALGNNEENEVYITLPGLAKTEVGVDVEIDRYPIGGGNTVSTYLAFDVPIPVGGVVEILKQPAVLNPRDVLKIRGVDVFGSGLSNAIDVCVSYEEVNSTNFIGFGTATPPNSGLGTAINNIGIVSASTNPIMLQSIRLTNTEFVGDYDVSILVNRPNGLTYNCTVPTAISAGSTIIFVDNLTNNSLETVVKPGNLVGLTATAGGTVLLSSTPVVSVGNTFVTVATGPAGAIGVGTYVTFTIDDNKYLARNLMIPAFASVELCDTPKRIEPGFQILMNAEVVGIDANEASTIDINVSGRNITL